MAVKIRLTRVGRHKDPIYRIVVADSRVGRDGAYIDKVGHYNPIAQPAEIVVDAEKAKAWLAKGVQPTDTVKNILVNQGVIPKPTKLSPAKTKVRKSK